MKKSTFDDDIDGKPIDLESSDNRPLALVADYDDEEDIDGKPISNIANDIDGRPLHSTQECLLTPTYPFPKDKCFPCSTSARPHFHEEVESNSTSTAKPRFVPTKWQSIDPNQVAAQGNHFFEYMNTKIPFIFS